MNKAIKTAICILIISLTFSSCTKPSKRINDLTIVQALAADKSDNKTEVSLQYLNLYSGSGSTEQLQGNITSITKGKGDNLSDAVFNASKTVSNDIFLGQNKLIILGSDWAKANIDNSIEYFLKNSASRPDVLVAIGNPSAEAIVKSKENGAKIPAENIYSLIKLGEENGHAPDVSVADLLNLFNDETSDIFFPVLKAEKECVKCEGTAVFSNNKYALTLNEEETLGFLTVKGRFKSGIVTFEVKELETVSTQITSSSVKKSIEIKNGRPIFKIKIKNKLTADETGKTIKKPLNESDTKLIQKACEAKIKTLCEKAVKKCFENDCDPFMTARYLYLEDKALYDKLKDNWRDNLKNIDIEVSVNSQLQRISNNTAS